MFFSQEEFALYEHDVEFLDWALSLDIDDPLFLRVQELQQAFPHRL